MKPTSESLFWTRSRKLALVSSVWLRTVVVLLTLIAQPYTAAFKRHGSGSDGTGPPTAVGPAVAWATAMPGERAPPTATADARIRVTERWVIDRADGDCGTRAIPEGFLRDRDA